MGKILIVSIFVITIAALWIRAQWAINKNRRASKKLVNGLRNNHFGIRDLAASLDTILLRKPITEHFDFSALGSRIQQLNGKSYGSKYSIAYAAADKEGYIAIIAEATVKGYLEAGDVSTRTTLHYPCWFYIRPDTNAGEWLFFSVMPVDTDHQHAQEDFAKWVYTFMHTV